VISIDPKSHAVETDKTGRLGYDRLLLATGARSIPLSVPGSDLHGVVKLDDLDDTRRILSLLRHNRSAVVVGGGILAIELVEGLVEQGIKVDYLLGDWYWSISLLNQISHDWHHLVQDGSCLPRTEIEEILGKNGKVMESHE
jgi:NADPH-dependent 2,4-dienoyl-CoA reductase/sulfur reductase-like enzyme